MSTNVKSRVTRSSTRESTKNASSNNGIATPTNDSTTTTATTTNENNTNSTNNNANAKVLNPGLPFKISRRRKATNTPIEAGESKIPNTNTTPPSNTTTTPSDTKNNASNNSTIASNTTTPSNTNPTIITITTPTTTTMTTTSSTSTTTTSETNNRNHANSHNANAAASSSFTLTAHENLEPNSLNNSSSSISTIDVAESSSATNTPQTSNLTKIPSNITESIQATSLTENATVVNPTVVENHNHNHNHNVHSSNINSVNTPPSTTSPPLHLQFTLEDEREFQKRVDEELKEALIFTPPSSPQNKEDDDSENEKPIPSDCMDAVSAFDYPTLINPKRPIRVEPQPHPQPKRRKSPEESSTDHDRFLLAGFSELRNLETELYTREIIARLESQVFAFYQSILRRDSLIKKLIKDIEEKDLIIQSIPKELLVNWGVLANLQKRQ